MNLKEKAKEAKEYGEVKTELIELTEIFLIKYKEYEEFYKNIFAKWTGQIIIEFESIFKLENFEVTTKLSNHSGADNKYKTIRALLYDLEFELLITTGECSDIRFIQTKPETEVKNIVIRPNIKKYYINGIYVIINGSSKMYNDGSHRISTVYDLEEKKEKVKNAKFSVSQMKEFILEIKKDMPLLFDELEKIKVMEVRSIAIPTGKYGNEVKDSSYGEFEKFSELIERI